MGEEESVNEGKMGGGNGDEGRRVVRCRTSV